MRERYHPSRKKGIKQRCPQSHNVLPFPNGVFRPMKEVKWSIGGNACNRSRIPDRVSSRSRYLSLSLTLSNPTLSRLLWPNRDPVENQRPQNLRSHWTEKMEVKQGAKLETFGHLPLCSLDFMANFHSRFRELLLHSNELLNTSSLCVYSAPPLEIASHFEQATCSKSRRADRTLRRVFPGCERVSEGN